MAGLLGSLYSGLRNQLDRAGYAVGGAIGQLNQLPMSTGQVYNAYIASGMSPMEAANESRKFAAGILRTPIKYQPGKPVPPALMAEGPANAAVNPANVKRVANDITGQSQYSLLQPQTQPTQPQGEWYQQLGGFFNERPALTQGLLTTGLGMAAGLSGADAFTTGGAAMQERQTAMSAAEQKAYDRLAKGREFELETMKTNADILQAIALGAKDNTKQLTYSDYLEEAKTLGFKDPRMIQQYALDRMSGVNPQIKQKKGIFGQAKKGEYYI